MKIEVGQKNECRTLSLPRQNFIRKIDTEICSPAAMIKTAAIVGTVLGTLVSVAGIPQPAWAAQPETAAKQQTLRQDAKKPVANALSQPGRRPTTAPGKPWSIEDALPKNSSAVRQPAAESSAGGLGRIRAGQGTFGVETESKFKANELPDGRPVPAPSQNAQQPSQYLGLSLSLPTLDKSIIPLAPFWGRSE